MKNNQLFYVLLVLLVAALIVILSSRDSSLPAKTLDASQAQEQETPTLDSETMKKVPLFVEPQPNSPTATFSDESVQKPNEFVNPKSDYILIDDASIELSTPEYQP